MGTEDAEFSNGGCDAPVEVSIVTHQNGRRFNVSMIVSHVPEGVYLVNCNISMISENGGVSRQILFYARRACHQNQIWASEKCEDCPFLHNRNPEDTRSCTINMVFVVLGTLMGSVAVLFLVLAGGCCYFRDRSNNTYQTTENEEKRDDAAFPDGRERQQARFETPIS